MLTTFIRFKNYYIPLDQSDNNFRHFGFKHNKLLFLEAQELLFLVSKEVKDTFPAPLKGYFEVKNKGFNLLPLRLGDPLDYPELVKGNVVEYGSGDCDISLDISVKLRELEAFEFVGPCNEYKVYKKTKNFLRSDKPLGSLRFFNKNERLKDVLRDSEEIELVCVLGEEDFVFLEVTQETLSLELGDRQRKGVELVSPLPPNEMVRTRRRLLHLLRLTKGRTNTK